jgi:hypothetical protein
MPCFGWSDLWIYDECNLNSKSFSNVGHKYQCPKGITYNTSKSKTYLAG